MEPCRFLWTTHVGFRKESRGFGSDHCKLSQNRNLQIFRQFNSLKWFLRVKLEKACNLELWKLISNLLWHYQIRHITLRCERESPIFCKLAILYPPHLSLFSHHSCMSVTEAAGVSILILFSCHCRCLFSWLRSPLLTVALLTLPGPMRMYKAGVKGDTCCMCQGIRKKKTVKQVEMFQFVRRD